jgi:hypothetical protein
MRELITRLIAVAKGGLYRQSRPKETYWLTRFVLLRLLGFVYLFAYLSLALQVRALIGHRGILPADLFLQKVQVYGAGFWQLPSLFWLGFNDTVLVIGAWFGVALSIIVLSGYANAIMLVILWILYMSYVHIGQLFYGYGWEMQMIETGLLAAFLVPLLDGRPFPKRPTPIPVIWLFRWLLFRVELGTALIKLRADECWKTLTCLDYHFETNPIPNPLSPWFHYLPKPVLRFGGLYTLFAQLIPPWFFFGPRTLRILAALLTLLMQALITVSGNYSFFNWLTILPILALFDDAFLERFLPQRLAERAKRAESEGERHKWHERIAWLFFGVTLLLSIPVVRNLASEHQAMNAAFNNWDIVNSYGAFGGVTRERYELIIEGFDGHEWKEYNFIGKPGPVDRPLRQIAPYQPRIDWQIWFAAMSGPASQPWLLHFVWMLLEDDPLATGLLAENPFAGAPPLKIRIQYYRYTFNKPWAGKPVWDRKLIGLWLPPVSLKDKAFADYIHGHGWE